MTEQEIIEKMQSIDNDFSVGRYVSDADKTFFKANLQFMIDYYRDKYNNWREYQS